MQRGFFLGGLLSLLTVIPLQAEKPKAKGNNAPTLPAEKVLRAGQSFAGTIAKVAGNALTIRVEIPKIEANKNNNGGNKKRPQAKNRNNNNRNRNANRGKNARGKNNRGGNNRIQQLIRQQQQQRQKLMQQLAKNRNNAGVKVTQETKQILVTVSTNAYIRQIQPPTVYGKDGFLTTPDKEELKKLRGNNPKLPGYKTDQSALKEGAIVQLTMAKDKRTNNELQAILVVVHQEGTGPKDRKKKKKD